MRLKLTFQFFFSKKPKNIHLAGNSTCAPHDKLTCKCSIGKLLKFYTSMLILAWLAYRILIFGESAHAYIWQKGQNTRLAGKKTLCARKKQILCIGKALEILHKKHNAGRRTDFWSQKSSDFSGEIFLERFFWREITARTTLFPLLSCGVDSFSPNYNICRKTFSRPLFQKEASKSEGVPSFESFPRREHSSGSNFPANSSRSISRHYWMT